MIVRFLAAGAVLAFALGAAAAAAQQPDDGDDGQAVVVQINGPCTLTIDGRQQTCQGVAYMVAPAGRRIAFGVVTDKDDWMFSGQDDDKRAGAYSLTLDRILQPGVGDMDADGECDMQVAGDGRTVKSLECKASTKAGEFDLKASGVASLDDEDDGDDEDDTGQG